MVSQFDLSRIDLGGPHALVKASDKVSNWRLWSVIVDRSNRFATSKLVESLADQDDPDHQNKARGLQDEDSRWSERQTDVVSQCNHTR